MTMQSGEIYPVRFWQFFPGFVIRFTKFPSEMPPTPFRWFAQRMLW